MSDKLKPEIMAYSKGLTVIPFVNVMAVDGDIYDEGTDDEYNQISIALSKGDSILISGSQCDVFISLYNNYLRLMEIEYMSESDQFVNNNSNQGDKNG